MIISPLARPFPALAPIAGVRIGTATAGYKPWTRADVTLVEFAPGTAVAGVLTQSRCPSPEVELCRLRLMGGRARGLVVNAGNSNAFTGAAGRAAAEAQSGQVAALLGCATAEVFAASTGIIGVPLAPSPRMPHSAPPILRPPPSPSVPPTPLPRPRPPPR
jgi:glutamate N-acetyltransferase/amino-acid N-acetyltransferase